MAWIDDGRHLCTDEKKNPTDRPIGYTYYWSGYACYCHYTFSSFLRSISSYFVVVVCLLPFHWIVRFGCLTIHFCHWLVHGEERSYKWIQTFCIGSAIKLAIASGECGFNLSERKTKSATHFLNINQNDRPKLVMMMMMTIDDDRWRQ